MKVLSVIFMFAAVGFFLEGDGLLGACLTWSSIHMWCWHSQQDDEDGSAGSA
jgi:hypothetical protein